jgi:hypothetical protein
VGKGEIDADAYVLERREGGVEVEVEVRIENWNRGRRNGGMEENAKGEISEEERHGPRMQARQEGPDLRIEAGRIIQIDEDEDEDGNEEIDE